MESASLPMHLFLTAILDICEALAVIQVTWYSNFLSYDHEGGLISADLKVSVDEGRGPGLSGLDKDGLTTPLLGTTEARPLRHW